MSLINEALKKAQRLHGESSAAAGSSLPVAGGSRVAPRRPAQTTPLLLIFIGSALLVVGGMLAVFLWPKGNPPAPLSSAVLQVAATPSPPAPAAPSPPPVVVAPVPASPVTPAPAVPTVAFPFPAAVAPVPSVVAPTAPPLVTPAPPPAMSPPPALPAIAFAPTLPGDVPAAASAVSPLTPAPLLPAAVAALPKPDASVTAAIDALRVNTVSSAGSRVILNNQVFKVGDVVNRNLGLRLTQITPHRLTFADAAGLEYVKDF